MAVNRALSYAERLGTLDGAQAAAEPAGDLDRKTLRDVLELWYLKTRFAYRIPLEDVIETLLSYPGKGRYWSGGREGSWLEGENPHP